MADPTENAEVKLIDFGLSKRYSTHANLEKMHTVVGTPYYVAPEVLKGEYGKECDVWSLGIILFVFLCGYPPFEGDTNKQIFKNVLSQKLTFDPRDLKSVSLEAKDLVSRMLEKDPAKRITADQCCNHPWFIVNHDTQKTELDKLSVLNKIKSFHMPKKLQMEALTFLVNNVSAQGQICYDSLKNAFRALDTKNTGTLCLQEIRQGFSGTNLTEAEIVQLFEKLDYNHDGEINYTEFLTVTAEKRAIMTAQNLRFAFHHFDVDNTGFISAENLIECFKREGKHISEEEINQMIDEIHPTCKGMVSFEDFERYMTEELMGANSPTKVGSTADTDMTE